MTKEMTPVKRLTFTAVFIALCIVLPFAFHAIPEGGKIFSPMHIPVLLCGLTAGPVSGLICGLAGPFLSSLITGMPAPAMLPSMTIELAVYGLVSGLMMQHVHIGKLRSDLYLSLLTAMLCGRIAGGVVSAVLYTKGTYSLPVWVTAYFAKGAPGILLQLILIPVIYFALERSSLFPKRYVASRA